MRHSLGSMTLTIATKVFVDCRERRITTVLARHHQCLTVVEDVVLSLCNVSRFTHYRAAAMAGPTRIVEPVEYNVRALCSVDVESSWRSQANNLAAPLSPLTEDLIIYALGIGSADLRYIYDAQRNHRSLMTTSA